MNAYLFGLSSNKPTQRIRPAALAGCLSGAGAIFHRPSGDPKAIKPSDGSQSAGQFRVTQEGRTKTIAWASPWRTKSCNDSPARLVGCDAIQKRCHGVEKNCWVLNYRSGKIAKLTINRDCVPCFIQLWISVCLPWVTACSTPFSAQNCPGEICAWRTAGPYPTTVVSSHVCRANQSCADGIGCDILRYKGVWPYVQRCGGNAFLLGGDWSGLVGLFSVC